MAGTSPEPLTAEYLDISHIITEDDTPVDNIFSEKQQRLLAESLNSSWKPGRPFLAAADVGIFHSPNQPPIVPDMFLSLDVQVGDDMWEQKNRSYFIWEFGKPPDIVVEIVSNTKGRETGRKFRIYERIGVLFYIIFDPQRLVQKDPLRVFQLSAGRYIPNIGRLLGRTGIGAILWDGVFEEKRNHWLRWLDHRGNLIPTGRERAEAERERAEQTERELAREREKAERLMAKLRALGISPED